VYVTNAIVTTEKPGKIMGHMIVCHSLSYAKYFDLDSYIFGVRLSVHIVSMLVEIIISHLAYKLFVHSKEFESCDVSIKCRIFW
jgi:hypothetical protein